jgi:hypothetical protein
MKLLVLVIPCLALLGSARSQENGPSRPDKDYAAHVTALRKRLPEVGFTVVVEAPFVVIGDQPEDDVKAWADGTVRWAVGHLKKEYFERDPEEILDIWLFKDEESYRTNAKKLFGVKPDTPFGWYSPRHRALIMNISTGGGTLVHEIVHPFMAVNFPGCPAWFNEGLGSLYEQSTERQGRIVGLTNWRLEGLQDAIREKKVPTIETLCSTASQEFYEKDRGTNYAQARYLLYWLQEKGLLRRFYREFLEHRTVDPSGYQTLKRITGAGDMVTFHREWEEFVLGLRFP